MNTYICYVTLHLRDDPHSAAFLCYRNRAEIIVLLCKQKPYPVFQVFMPAQQLSSMVWTYNVASVGSYKTQPQLAATKRSLSWQLQNAASVGSYKMQPQLAAKKLSLSWQLQNAGHRSQVQDKLKGRLVQSWVKITQG